MNAVFQIGIVLLLCSFLYMDSQTYVNILLKLRTCAKATAFPSGVF